VDVQRCDRESFTVDDRHRHGVDAVDPLLVPPRITQACDGRDAFADLFRVDEGVGGGRLERKAEEVVEVGVGPARHDRHPDGTDWRGRVSPVQSRTITSVSGTAWSR
jgi:hypothetical protein